MTFNVSVFQVCIIQNNIQYSTRKPNLPSERTGRRREKVSGILFTGGCWNVGSSGPILIIINNNNDNKFFFGIRHPCHSQFRHLTIYQLSILYLPLNVGVPNYLVPSGV